VRAKQQGVLENYFTAIRLKSQINAGSDKSSQGTKSKTKTSVVKKSSTSSQQ
jgi:hypothetical protein